MVRARPRHPRSIEAYFAAIAYILTAYTQVKTDLTDLEVETQTGVIAMLVPMRNHPEDWCIG
jgi:hypothetical protein